MIAILSPAKLMEEKFHYPDIPSTQPLLQKDAARLVGVLRKKSAKELATMMDLSPALAAQNYQRFQQWKTPFTSENAYQSALLFRGEVYRGLDATSLSLPELKFAQDHLRILSGLYGILRPLDLIQPYRLMMGTKFSPAAGVRNLYAYWGNKPAEALMKEIQAPACIVNLASSEYADAVLPHLKGCRVVQCDFKERKGDGLRSVQTFTKLARGYMARFIVTERIDRPEGLREFSHAGYRLDPSSSKDKLLFVR